MEYRGAVTEVIDCRPDCIRFSSLRGFVLNQ
eukprot:IDg9736t1